MRALLFLLLVPATLIAQPPQAPSVSILYQAPPVVPACNCDCLYTGICDCSPGKCECPGCLSYGKPASDGLVWRKMSWGWSYRRPGSARWWTRQDGAVYYSDNGGPWRRYVQPVPVSYVPMVSYTAENCST